MEENIKDNAFEYRQELMDNGEIGYVAPIVFQFMSEKTNGVYHRIGDVTRKFNDAIYRVSSYDDLALLTEGEVAELIKQHYLLASLLVNSEGALNNIIEYCKIKN